MTLGEIIKKKRLERGLTQRALARKLGVRQVSIHDWETGHCMPYLLNCWDLADFFECSIDELCGRNFERKKENEN